MRPKAIFIPERHFFLIAIISLIILGRCQSPIPEEIAAVYNDLPDVIDFNFHIKPIISDRCYKCHGPDGNARKAEFRLDLEEVAFAKLKVSGGHAFVKGNVGKSVAWQRVTSDDPEFQMPPPESNLSLSTREKALITKWIDQGAEWKEHWAFISPVKQDIPEAKGQNTINPIDNFILAKLEEQNLSPSLEADKERLIRRVTLDLTGLPPTIQEIDDFLSDNSLQAYEKLVERLFTTDAHAERMAMEWLDVARYGDSQGMHADKKRFSWPWRDWVINAFKENLPYDQFISWQLAGDLLPDANKEQKLATAFHRNHPVSAEGGIIDEEFRVKYVLDRTNTTATAFMGLTMECASCHDHKFDPISQKEYYQMSAFFNNLKEIGMVAEGGFSSGPVMLLPDPKNENELKELSSEIDKTYKLLELSLEEVKARREFIHSIQNQKITPPVADASYPLDAIEKRKQIKLPFDSHRYLDNTQNDIVLDNNLKSVASGAPQLVKGKKGNALRLPEEYDLILLKDVGIFEINQPFSAGAWISTEKEGENQSIMTNASDSQYAWRGWDLFLDQENRPTIRLSSFLPHNYIQITAGRAIPKNEWHHVFFTYDGSAKARGLQLYVNGKTAHAEVNYDNLYRSIINKWKAVEGWQQWPVMVGRSGRYFNGDSGAFTGSVDEIKLFNRYLSPLEVAVLFEAEINSSIGSDGFTEADYIEHYHKRSDHEYAHLKKQLQGLLAKKLSLLEDIPEIMVMEDMPEPRKTHVLNRGQYDAPTEEVKPGTPQQILPFPEDLPKNRHGLAQWLVDKRHPLTARVTVNRYWQMIFGRGIVETPQDFGTQGALPSHPELLDWLAIKFLNSGWNVRALLKTMVRSATYRQSSVPTDDHLEKDAQNLFLARGPSYRLQAEMIRDNALAASGLLRSKVGGASVKPYQPPGVWGFGSSGLYQVDSGDDLYRRSLYTFVRRTTPHPAMMAFDASSRSVCTVKREKTNTPLQALVLLNDPQFVEAARVLAQRMQKEVGVNLEQQIKSGFRLVCGRNPNAYEMDLMQEQYQMAFEKYSKHPNAAEELLEVGEYPFDPGLGKIETAALTMVANTMMNFDEAYMKR